MKSLAARAEFHYLAYILSSTSSPVMVINSFVKCTNIDCNCRPVMFVKVGECYKKANQGVYFMVECYSKEVKKKHFVFLVEVDQLHIALL